MCLCIAIIPSKKVHYVLHRIQLGTQHMILAVGTTFFLEFENISTRKVAVIVIFVALSLFTHRIKPNLICMFLTMLSMSPLYLKIFRRKVGTVITTFMYFFFRFYVVQQYISGWCTYSNFESCYSASQKQLTVNKRMKILILLNIIIEINSFFNLNYWMKKKFKSKIKVDIVMK